jgi:hypothetical protein
MLIMRRELDGVWVRFRQLGGGHLRAILGLGGGIALAAALFIGVQWASALQIDLRPGSTKMCSPTNVGSAYVYLHGAQYRHHHGT